MNRLFGSLVALAASSLLCACGQSSRNDTKSGTASDSGTTSDSGTSSSDAATADSGSAVDAGPEDPLAGIEAPEPTEPLSPYIVVDQFGYRPNSEKIAVIRDPQTGWDASQSFTPGSSYALVDALTGDHVVTGAPSAWNGGATDPSSGDRAWWFDFSSQENPGYYYVLDTSQQVRSAVFAISPTVYREVLRHAVRMFFYQRAGFAKEAKYAGAGWADGASHMGPLQDSHCRRYSSPGDASTERDLHGGWYDAGDYNKYTSWTAGYVLALLHSYAEHPVAFRDDTEIPESGNGIPDILDEVKWGMDWLVRMQQSDGSVLSIVGLASASPPSAATGPSLYGDASTAATLGTAAAFAYGSKIFSQFPSLETYAADLLDRAERAWSWAEANPNVTFYNNDSSSGTEGLGSGQQETDDYGRTTKKLQAAVHLFDATGDGAYRTYVDQTYQQMHLFQYGSFAYPFELAQQEALLYYASLPGATAATANAIESTYRTAMDSTDNFGAFRSSADPYMAYLKDYVWGSNSTKADQGSMFYDIVLYGIAPSLAADAERAAERYIHYLHGVNPFGIVYLTNMKVAGAENSINEIYHTWFTDGSAKWDRVGESTYGPPPGFLAGGPNPSYAVDGCCPSSCGSPANNAPCSQSTSPPSGQPDQKSYKDFNANWPLDSWQISEPSDGYQAAYIQLLSKFAE